MDLVIEGVEDTYGEGVARAGIEPATFRFSGGLALALELFALVRPDAKPAIRRVGSARLMRWPHEIAPTSVQLYATPLARVSSRLR